MLKSENSKSENTKTENNKTSIAIEKVDKDRDVCLVPKNINDESISYSDGETSKSKIDPIPILKTNSQTNVENPSSDSQTTRKVAFPQSVIEKSEQMETDENAKSEENIKS